MDVTLFLLDVLKYTLAGLIVFLVAWYFVRNYLLNSYKSHLIDLKKSSIAQTLPLRLQAYERSCIFIERINPANMLVRLHVSGATVRELQHLVLSDIRAEYQHNLSQQLYVSDEVWNLVKRLKEDTISMMSNVAKSLPGDAPSVELSRVMLTHLSELDENPYDIAISAIKGEMQRLF